MRRFPMNFLLLILLVGFGIFFGVDMAAKGKSPGPGEVHVSGLPAMPSSAPATAKGPSTAGATVALTAASADVRSSEKAESHKAAETKTAKENARYVSAGPAAETAQAPGDSFLNRLSNKLGEVVRILAGLVVGWAVSLINVLLS